MKMKLFVYDHCPYCVKARMIFAFKNIDFELITLANDDEQTPIKMIGQKMLPILEYEKNKFMPESLDIISFIDHLNPPANIEEYENSDLREFLDEYKHIIYQLAMPRWAESDLEEFNTKSAREYFINKKSAYIGDFKENLEQSNELIAVINHALLRLDKIVFSENFVNAKLSIDDFHLFAFLRSLSIVKGIKYPAKIDKYMQNMHKATNIDLHKAV